MQKYSKKELPVQKKYKLIFTILWVILLLFCIMLPMFGGTYYTRFVSLIFIYVILAVGYNIASGYCGMTTFSAAALYAAGAYTSAVVITTFNAPFFVGVLAAIGAAGFVSLAISLPAIKVKGFYLTLISMGVLEIVQRILVEWHGVTGGSVGFYVAEWKLFGIPLDRYGKFYIILVAMVLTLWFQRNLVKSRWGRDFKAIQSNEIAAGGMGINFRSYRILGFFINASISGIAGAFYASFSGYLSPDTFGFSMTVFVLLMVIVGGGGTLSGPVIGAVIATIIPEFFNTSPDLKQIIYGATLIVLTQILPGGLVGSIKKRFSAIDDNIYVTADSQSRTFDFSDYTVKNSSDDDVILEVKDLTKIYGGLTAVNHLNMTIRRGTVHSLIGPNGAGKSTTVNMITGIDPPSEGTVLFNNDLISGMNMWQLARRGISRTYQHVRLFRQLSALENVAIGTRLSYTHGLWGAIFRSKQMRKEEQESFEEALNYLRVIGLEDKLNTEPESLSSGQQKLLELARALCMKPEFLVLDEPCAGLTETETLEFSALIQKIRKAGISVLLIEHHMSLVMEISDYITVLDYGKKIAEGTPAEISVNPVVRKAYLGEEEE